MIQVIKTIMNCELYANCSKIYGEEEYDYSGNATIYSNDPSFQGGIPFSGYSYEGESTLFTDALFNGEEKNISLMYIQMNLVF